MPYFSRYGFPVLGLTDEGKVGDSLTKPHPYNYYVLASHLRPVNGLKPGQKLSGDVATIEILVQVKIGLLLFLIPENAKQLPSAYAKAEMMSRYLDDN
jgi:hypothetical protein